MTGKAINNPNAPNAGPLNTERKDKLTDAEVKAITENIIANLEPYKPKEGVLFLVAGIDIADKRINTEIVGWNTDKKLRREI